MTVIRRRLAGLFALLLIMGIVIGLPVVLFTVGANPFSGGIPTLDGIKDALLAPDDGTLAIGLIKVVGWASWAFLTISILVELVARLRGVRPPRLPGLAVTQSAARGLVGAAMMLFVAVPAAGAAPAPAPAAAAPVSSPVVAQTAASTAPTSAPSTTASTASATQTAAEQTAPGPEVVQHFVRRGETLWSIAAERLGDGHRYREIVELNRELLGGRADFIKAGWVLDIPASPRAADTGTVLVQKGDTLSQIAKDQLGEVDRYGEIFQASRSIPQPGGARLTDPDLILPGWTLKVPGSDASSPASGEEDSAAPVKKPSPAPARPAPQPAAPPAAPETPTQAPAAAGPSPETSAPAAPSRDGGTSQSSSSVPAAEDAAAEHLQEDSDWIVRTSYGVGALMAAGVLGLIASRRRTQQRRRSPGQRMPMPQGPAAELEQQLRATADMLSVETVDVALRSLARRSIETGTPLPVVRAARLTATQFDLYLAEPFQLPHPWSGTADTTVWTLELGNTGDLDAADVADVPAPYPALVTLGHDDEDGHVFLNLEHLGALGVAGGELATREILAALAIELATSTWADDLQVTVVGAFADLEDTLQTGRIRYLPSAGRILDELEQRAAQDRAALAEGGANDLHTARVAGIAPDAWSPEIVLLAGQVTSRQRTQLEQLATGMPRVALAAVTSGVNVGEWGLQLSDGDPDAAVLSPIGLHIRPQRLPAEQYGHLLEVAALADMDELDVAAPLEPSVAAVEAVTPITEAVESISPVSAMPEVTLAALEAAAAHCDAAVAEPAGTDPTESRGAQDTVPDRQPVSDEPAAAGADEPGRKTAAREQAADVTNEPPEADQEALVQPMPLPAPEILVLGPVDLLHAGGKVEPTKRARLLEYAAYLALNPGATHTAIDNAIWPDRKTEDNLNTRNPATSKLRRWVGTDPDGNEYLPRHQAGEGYSFLPSVTTDVSRWDELLAQSPMQASTEQLEQALSLVRGIPFEGTHRKRYAWAEPLKQRLISEIVDASYELARRRLMAGRWRAAEQAVVVGLLIEPAQENLWRLRILAAHESRNPAAESEAIERLLTITEQLECDLEPETEQLLAALKTPGTDFDQLMANAL